MMIKYSFSLSHPLTTLERHIYMPPNTHYIRSTQDKGFKIETKGNILAVCFCPPNRTKYELHIKAYDIENTLLVHYQLTGKCDYPKSYAVIAFSTISLLGVLLAYVLMPKTFLPSLSLSKIDTLRIGTTVSYIDESALMPKLKRLGFKGTIINQYGSQKLPKLADMLFKKQIDCIVTEAFDPQVNQVIWSKPYSMHDKTDGLKLGLLKTNANQRILSSFSPP